MPAASDHLSHTIQALSALGFRKASACDIVSARNAAAALVGDDIATSETLCEVHAITGGCAFVARLGGELIAMISVIPLRRAAIPVLEAGAFDGVAPPRRLIARPGEPPAAFYVWGAAGLSWRGRRLALAASVAVRDEVYPDLPLYARAATADGERVLQRRMGAIPIAGGLVRAAPRPWRAAA